MPTLTQNSDSPAAIQVSEMAPSQRQPEVFRCRPAQSVPGADVGEWQVKIVECGRSHIFSLRASSKDAAIEEAKTIHDTILAEGWNAALRKHSVSEQASSMLSPGDLDYWKERLLLRRYHFPATEGSGNHWAVRIEHDGTGYWFPLGTPDPDAAARKARQIYQAAMSQGWEVVFNRFSRELIVNFEWNANPILWTYTTIHTLVESTTTGAPSTSASPASCKAIILETEAGIRRALQWCVNQQPGFQAEGCGSPDLLLRMLATHKPSLILLNRSLAERIGVTVAGGPTTVKPGILAVSYSVSVDGDQMFVSTPGGAEGYLLKRVKPSALFDPVARAIRLPNSSREDILGSVKSYFKELLRLRLDGETNALARLTPRENDVLALLSKGCVDKEIAQALDISIWTVHGHIKKIFDRLNVRTRTEAVVRYLEK